MKKVCFTIVLFCLSNLAVFGQSKLKMEDLKLKISDELKKHKGSYAVAFKDLTTGETLSINEHETFHAASTMKMPVMIEVFKQASQGKFKLTDSITIKNEFKSIVDGSLYSQDSIQDSDHILYRHIGEKRAIKDLVYEMIIVSSNFATNMVIDLVGAKNVTQTMRDLGAKDILILRGVEDAKAFQKGMNNTTNACDLRLLFEKMALGKIINQKACDAMIKILLDQKFNDVIPGNLPKDVKVAHKTGGLPNIQHDSGIVFLPDGRKYVLVILSRDWENEAANRKMLAGISEMIYLNLK
ncbi:serine hydrolase [Dyadobacter sp. CY356]|uniref:serine hydrolase n=1 Tax=Dyadobacter sp. CY356 TaxID=2906442 RepID=UPI001F27084B|nr:serine hydrolase [Dyadobacter sp. CY356]MCF0058725.1 class A beta-lactamase-related serine hydrolase [Dyadobacter sp. CY356]